MLVGRPHGNLDLMHHLYPWCPAGFHCAEATRGNEVRGQQYSQHIPSSCHNADYTGRKQFVDPCDSYILCNLCYPFVAKILLHFLIYIQGVSKLNVTETSSSSSSLSSYRVLLSEDRLQIFLHSFLSSHVFFLIHPVISPFL